MYKVLLVDDEIWSLEGIKKLFKWESKGFTVMAQLTDATEALELICREKPDVVFTDIRMPELSGIELLNKSRIGGSTAEFVIVSGFAEFEYAKEALRYGAFDYHLKPIDPEEADQLLNKLKSHLDEKQLAIDKAICAELSLGLHNPLDALESKGFHPIGDYWQVIAISGNDAIDKEAAIHLSSVNHIALKIANDKMMLICNVAQPIANATISRWAASRQLWVGVSSVTNEIGEIGRLMREADMAALRYFIEKRHIITQFNPDSNLEVERAVRSIEKLIMSKSYPEICKIVDQLPKLFTRENLGVYHVSCMWNQLAVIIHKRLDCDTLKSKIDFADYVELVSRFDDLTGMCEYLKELFKYVCCSSEDGPAKPTNYNENFMALLEYVNNNYIKELSLSELADRFYLNMSYCSELFKKVTSYTFTDYVTKLRMEKAVELFQSGGYTIERVFNMTGYNDYYYFCKIFKKFYGITPTQFLEKGCK